MDRKRRKFEQLRERSARHIELAHEQARRLAFLVWSDQLWVHWDILDLDFGLYGAALYRISVDECSDGYCGIGLVHSWMTEMLGVEKDVGI
jgi:hypothetical protein